MKKLLLAILFISTGIFAQEKHYNLKKGFVAEGYDVVAYFSKKAIKGNKKYTTEFDDVKFKFSSKENLEIFKKNPEKYTPAYGGFCAYAIGLKEKKVSINPKTFEVRDGKLYLFYNSWGVDTLKMWQEEGAENLREKADKNWLNIINK